MLTATQCEVAAYVTDGGIICPDCADPETDEPLIRYSLDEYASAYNGDFLRDEGPEPGCTEDCEPYGLACDRCGEELVEPYHYGHAEKHILSDDDCFAARKAQGNLGGHAAACFDIPRVTDEERREAIGVAERLKRQNAIAGWRDCEAAGLKHQFGKVQLVMDRENPGGPLAYYASCTRCPVTIRRTK